MSTPTRDDSSTLPRYTTVQSQANQGSAGSEAGYQHPPFDFRNRLDSTEAHVDFSSVIAFATPEQEIRQVTGSSTPGLLGETPARDRSTLHIRPSPGPATPFLIHSGQFAKPSPRESPGKGDLLMSDHEDLSQEYIHHPATAITSRELNYEDLALHLLRSQSEPFNKSAYLNRWKMVRRFPFTLLN